MAGSVGGIDGSGEFASGLEGGTVARRDGDLLPGGGIARGAGSAVLHVKSAEATQIDPVPGHERLPHANHEAFDDGFRLNAGEARGLRDALGNLSFRHVET